VGVAVLGLVNVGRIFEVGGFVWLNAIEISLFKCSCTLRVLVTESSIIVFL
jgi:hypothetical protein